MQRQSLRLVELITCVMSTYSLFFIMLTVSPVHLMQQIPDFMQPEASTEHTSPFSRKCVQIRPNRIVAEHVSTVEQTFAHGELQGQSNFSVLRMQHRDTEHKLPDTTSGRKNAPNFQVGAARARNAGSSPLP